MPLLSRSSDSPAGVAALAAALLGFFVITLDAVIVNVVLPSMQRDLGGGVTGLQWVVDGYTLMFAGLLLSAGSVVDRVGARRAFGLGMFVFVLASVGCGLAPGMGALVAARLVQGSAAAVLMPSSMALLRESYPDPGPRASALAVWALGGAVASSAGPTLGGVLDLFRSRPVVLSVLIGFTFMVGYFGLPFVFSIYPQQIRGLSALATGLVFLPMMLVGLTLTPLTARLAEPRRAVRSGR